MEGIAIAIISGLFSLAAIWLSHYLRERKGQPKEAPSTATDVSPRSTPVTRARQAQRPPRQKARATREFISYKEPGWWLALVIISAVSVGGALLAGWIVTFLLDIFNLDIPWPELGWLVLGLVGLLWGIVYAIEGKRYAVDWVECFGSLVAPYDDIFEPWDTGQRVRGLFTALPVNILLSWGIALAAGTAAASFLGASFDGVVAAVFALITLIGIVSFIREI